MAQNNANYKLWIDVRKQFKAFNVGDDLHACSTGPFQILKKPCDNAYAIDLFKSFGIGSTFNIGDLVDYKGLYFNPRSSLVDKTSHEPISERPSLLPFSNILPNTTHQVDNILDDEVITTKEGGTRKYLVWWKEKPLLIIHE